MTKRVGVLAPRLYDYGGITRVIKELSHHLSEDEDLEFEVLTTRINGTWHEEIDFEVTKLRPYPYPELAYRRPDVKRRLEEFDLLWNHNLYLNTLSTRVDLPFISTFHPPHGSFPGWFSNALDLKTKFDRYLNKVGLRYLPYIDRAVAISDQNKDRLSEFHKTKPVRIYHGADSEYASFSEEDEGFIFCPESPDETIESIAENYTVIALGDGDSDHIEFIGSVCDEELHQYYSECSFVVTASGMEGFGITPVEAAFHGKPSVVREIGGHKETVIQDKTGYLASNSKEFHEYCARLMEDKGKRREMGEEAFDHVKSKYTWERAANEYLIEFKDLIY